MVENVEYLALSVVDNKTNNVYDAKAIINLHNVKQPVSWINGEIISNSQYADGWKNSNVLPIDSLVKFDLQKMIDAMDTLIAQGEKWKDSIVEDISITFKKGSVSDIFRIELVAHIGGAVDWSNEVFYVKFYKGTSLEKSITLGFLRDYYFQGSQVYPHYTRLYTPSYNTNYMILNFVQIYENNVLKTYPSFEVNAYKYDQCKVGYDPLIAYNRVANSANLSISDSTVENIDTTQPYPPGEDEGGDGQGQTDEGSTPDSQTDNNDSVVDAFIGNGFFIPYLPTNATLESLGSTLWTDNYMQRFINKGIKFSDGIIDLFMIPIRWKNIQAVGLNICGVDMGITTYRATTTFQYIDLGTIDVPTRFGSFVDYRGYSTLKIYLPCIGFRTLNINDYMGKKIKLEYKVCVLDGSFIANVYSVDGNVSKITEAFNGNCALHMPVSSGNYNLSLMNMQMFPPLAVARRCFGQDNPDIHNSGNLSGTSAYLGTMTPYLIIDVPKMQVPQMLPTLKGYKSHCMAKLQDLHGYTEVKDIHIDVKGMTEDEKAEMLNILRSGIVI